MLTPQKEDVAEIAGYSDIRFGTWLKVGLDAFYLENKGRHAFPPMHPFIGRDYSLAADLAAIYVVLDSSAQAAYRGGIAISFAEASLESYQAIATLLDLAVATRAREILPVILDRLRRDWSDTHILDDATVDHILRTVASLGINAGPTSLTQYSIDCLVQIIQSRAFPPRYAEVSLTQLCRLRPSQIAANLALTRPYLEPLLTYVEDETEDDKRESRRKRIVEKVLQTAGINNVLPTLDPSLSNLDQQGRDWWSETLLSCLEPRLENGFLSARAAGDGTQAFIAVNDNTEFHTLTNDRMAGFWNTRRKSTIEENVDEMYAACFGQKLHRGANP